VAALSGAATACATDEGCHGRTGNRALGTLMLTSVVARGAGRAKDALVATLRVTLPF
jgi:hypothetical protein